MNAGKLYRIFGLGILALIIIACALYKIESHLTPSQNAALPLTPGTTPLSEVEFESGASALRLKTEQEKRLNEYRGNINQDQSVEVPLDRAIDAYLEGAR